MRNFIGFARGFIARKNPIKTFFQDCLAIIKDIFSINKKRKMVEYRLKATLYKQKRYEDAIAQSNEHTFLQGSKLNQLR